MFVSPALSSYMDTARFTAAAIVLAGHFQQDGINTSWLPLAGFSHESVIVFFVLSGFIIYSTSVGNQRSLREYVVARTSRILSVAWPAVVLCFALTWLLLYFQPEFVVQLSNYSDPSFGAFGSCLLFLNESWLNRATVPLNAPYWSLCYEVWYYILFGAWIYSKGRNRYLLLIVISAIAGPAVLVLFPAWLIGCVLAKHFASLTKSMPFGLALVIFFTTFGVVGWINIAHLDVAMRSWLQDTVPGMWRLRSSQRLGTDFVIAIAVAGNLAAFSRLPTSFHNFFIRIGPFAKYVAGFSFSLYLFHRPMTQLIGKVLEGRQTTVLESGALILLVIFACWLLSLVTERQQKTWKKLISWLYPTSVSNETEILVSGEPSIVKKSGIPPT